MLTLNSLAIGAASLFVLVAADHGHDLHARSHHHGVVDRSVHTLQKRFSGQATYYITGLGACGHYNNPSDHIVALNSAQFGTGYPGPNCQKYITICAFGKCVGAQITDECPTCDYGSLDLSEGLFQQFASTDKGVFQMTWTFNDGNDDTPKTTSAKKPETPKTTKQPETTKEPEPTTTWEPPTTTSTKKKTTTSSPPPETTSTPEPTTSKTSSTPEPTSTSEAKSSTSIAPTTISSSAVPSASASAAPTSSPVAGSGSSSGSGGSNLADANQIMLALGKLAVVANGGQ